MVIAPFLTGRLDGVLSTRFDPANAEAGLSGDRILRSPAAWKEAERICPGAGIGELVTLEEIEAKARTELTFEGAYCGSSQVDGSDRTRGDHANMNIGKRVVLILFVLGLFPAVSVWVRGHQFPIVSPEHKELFVDDYLIGKLVNLKRTLHQPVKHGPVLRPENPWENLAVQTRNVPFWVPDEKVWKLYYLAFARKRESRAAHELPWGFRKMGCTGKSLC